MNNKLFRLIGAGAIFLMLLVYFGASATTIKQGDAGVVYNRNGGIEDKTLGQGLHFIWNPMKKVTKYNISTKNVESPEMSLATKDGKPLTVDITYDYASDVERLPYIFNKFKGAKPEAIEESWMKARLKDSALSVTSKYTILDVFQKREEIRKEIQETFTESVGKHGFIVENVVFGTPKPDANTENAIQEVVNRQQELEALKIEKAKAKEIAEKKLIDAKGESDAEIEKARGVSKSNEIIDKSITPQLLKKMEMEARQKHGWVEINGAGGVMVDK